MILSENEITIFSMYLKNGIFYFYPEHSKFGRNWNCYEDELDDCELCHFNRKCVIVDDGELERQLRRIFPEGFEESQ